MKRRTCANCGALTQMTVCPACRTTRTGGPAQPKPVDDDQLAFDFTTTGRNT